MDADVVRGLLRPFLLLLVYERPGAGRELVERLARLGLVHADSSDAYRTLRDLEASRLLTSAGDISDNPGDPDDPAGRRYELTPEGVAALESWIPRLAGIGQVLEGCLARWAQAPGPRSLSGGSAR
ncbi:helix-turn-helix transcriptional regulator [Actinocorallia sp. A-T 12471]|uniref:helix-turn-helix transcriptional regulator n=1 Tax=Actinocorallia sp. A-T 12471 TaxID=3089813 RepID=UPI0029CF5C25|nr:helix-turn-helix transcriptional regulator [Actinocorallia sp. A-T 12471]MDX6739934.1 helix-turn-helix transcriptional regulator [Actinocorallia sp. A-T 12471]